MSEQKTQRDARLDALAAPDPRGAYTRAPDGAAPAQVAGGGGGDMLAGLVGQYHTWDSGGVSVPDYFKFYL